jgi:hypothetical protein
MDAPKVFVNVDAQPWRPTQPEHFPPVVPRTVCRLLDDPGFEQRVVEVARRALDDVPECRSANYSIRWLQPQNEPLLIVEFTEQAVLSQLGAAVPAVGLSLVLVRRGTLAETMPGRKLLEGDRLRDAVLRSVYSYLEDHGIVPSLTHDEGMRHAHV